MCDFCSYLKEDKPFRFHRTDEKTRKVLVGKNANKYLNKIENELFPRVEKSSIMTAIIGQPGSGKTQFLNYLQGIRAEKNRICIFMNLKDVKVDYDYLAKVITSDRHLQEYLNFYGFALKNEGSFKDEIRELGQFLYQIKFKNSIENCEICILVDAVDEYLRKIKSKFFVICEEEVNEIVKDIVKDLIDTVDQLLSDLPYTCIVLAITKDVASVFKNVLHKAPYNVLLDERFVFVSEDGEDLVLDKLEEDETQEMVSKFVSLWSKRNNLILPQYDKTVTQNDLNLFPFTPEAINIFWNAGFVPGDISLACLMALDRKLNFPSGGNGEEPDHLIVTEIDAAWIVTQFSNYFNYDKPGFKEKINPLLKGKQLEYNLEKISLKAQQTYFNFSESIVEAFEDYIMALEGDFHIEPGDRYKFTKSRYHIEKDFCVIDLVVKYMSVKIGLQFIFNDNNKELKQKVNNRKMKTLFYSLRNKQIGRSLIILISKEKDDEFTSKVKNNFEIYKNNRKYSEDMESINNSAYRIKYAPVSHMIQISEADAWRILGLHLKYEQNDKIENYIKHIEDSIQIRNSFSYLVQCKPDKIAIHNPSHSSGSLLDRSNL